MASWLIGILDMFGCLLNLFVCFLCFEIVSGFSGWEILSDQVSLWYVPKMQSRSEIPPISGNLQYCLEPSSSQLWSRTQVFGIIWFTVPFLHKFWHESIQSLSLTSESDRKSNSIVCVHRNKLTNEAYVCSLDKRNDWRGS